MRLGIIASSLAIVLLAGGLAGAKDTPDQQREKTRKMAAQTLEDLYKLQPTARELIQKSVGYAVFDNMGANLLLVSTARGSGIAVNSKTSQDAFMKMVSAGAGLGVGVKDYRVVFAFETEPALSKFLDPAWDGSAMRPPRQVTPAEHTREQPVDAAGYEVLQRRRTEQTIILGRNKGCQEILGVI